MDSPISWTAQLAIGNAEIDAQHQTLFTFADSLYAFCTAPNSPKTEIQKFLHEAASYAKYHFSCEEKLMRDIDYPNYTAHVKQHREFIAEVSKNIIAFSRDNRLSLEPFYAYITKWLVEHITKEDKDIARFMHPQQDSAEPDEQ